MGLFDNISLTTVEILQNNGYTVEVQNVTTEDGYILELHRIPRSKSRQKPIRNHPVFIHHGILGSSADWVLGGANRSLPMQLADDGYDVWLTNCRGNTYSGKHVSLTNKQKAYWNFSLHEIGVYDLPAAIDHVLINTKSQQLHYIGYSMGSCVFFIMASERPEYQQKIRSQISFAPVAYLSNTRSSMKYLAPMAKLANIIYQKLTNGMFMPQTRLQTFLAGTLYRPRFTQKLICEKLIIFSVTGTDPYHFDTKLIPLIMGHFPAGTSIKLVSHFSQFVLIDGFKQFDYGRACINMQHYNSSCPPFYNLKSIHVPITLIYGKNDILTNIKDVLRLKIQLPKLMDAFPINSPYWNHVDFLWSKDVTKQVNDPTRKILGKTDNLNWEYSMPNNKMVLSNTIDIDDRKGFSNALIELGVTSSLKSISSWDYIIKENLNTLIANIMPRYFIVENDVQHFEQELELQKIVFSDLDKFIKLVEKKYGRLHDNFTSEIFDWTNEVANSVTGAYLIKILKINTQGII